jgi:Fe-S-cluster-containing dehydrogenase component
MAGAKMAFGSAANTVYKIDQAQRILSLDADIFSGFNVRYVKDFSKGRAYSEEKKEINRLYSIETTMTLTGAKADHRLAVKPSQMTEIAKAIAAAIGVSGATSTYTENSQWIQAMAKDFIEHKGKSLVLVGQNQPPMVHALAHAMNAALGNVGQTVSYTEPVQMNAETAQVEMLRQLIGEIDGGAVNMLVILGGNPVYNTPADLKLNKERMEKIPVRVHLGHYVDETAELCQWHIAEKHFLEMWSDTKAYDGTVSIVQPLIDPLYDGKSAHEVTQVFFKENFDKKDHDIVKEFWQKQGFAATPKAFGTNAGADSPKSADVQPSPNTTATPFASPVAKVGENNQTASSAKAVSVSFEENWRKSVHDGFIPNTAAASKTVAVNSAFLTQSVKSTANAGELEISILPDPSVYDGRFANNGWLQELPNRLTKITWDNVALISPSTAKRLGINQNKDYDDMAGGELGTAFINTYGGNLSSDLANLTYQDGQIQKPVPMWVSPGQPDDVITIYMGYGRTRAGKVGTGLGYSVFDVQRSDAMWNGTGNISKTGEQTQIASTQIHFNMEGRDLLQVYEVEEFATHPDVNLSHDEYPKSMYTPFKYDGNKWGMTIDLNSCVGCNACVIACQAENNIPVVGKQQIARSREMHWMRIDSYFGGDDINNPEGPYPQPVLCQQCEQAPCETVCPVHATVHSAEGLNDMVYNRCVGTRYCSNNCPYKVRRFNFFLYQDWNTPQYKLMRNPEVSIRSRGVMEKCTYCTQRISSARIEAEKDGRKIRDGEILTACQSACPADAIAFGDLNDEGSKVAKSKKDHRNYNLLNELNTQPRTTYLTGLKNMNKEMPGYKALKIPEEKLGTHDGGNKGEKSTEAAH